jgi:exonuclease III
MLELVDIIKRMDLKDIYRAFHPNTKEYTFFSGLMELFPKLATYSVTKQVLETKTDKIENH